MSNFCTRCGLQINNGTCPNCGYTSPDGNSYDNNRDERPRTEVIIEPPQEPEKTSKCPICGVMNDPSLSECVSCGNLLSETFTTNSRDLLVVRQISESERQKYFLIGLGLISKFLRDKIPDYKMCFRCGESVGLGDRHCPRCRHSTVLTGMEELFKGNYEPTLLRDIDELFPEFEIRDQTNAAYFPYQQLMTMKIDCETIASMMSSTLRALAVFLNSATQSSRLPMSVQPFLQNLQNRVNEVQSGGESRRPAPSGEIIDQIRRVTGDGPTRPWNG